MHKIYYMDNLVESFFAHFNRHYADALATDFGSLSLQQQVAYVRMLYKVHVHITHIPHSVYMCAGCTCAYMYVQVFVCVYNLGTIIQCTITVRPLSFVKDNVHVV